MKSMPDVRQITNWVSAWENRSVEYDLQWWIKSKNNNSTRGTSLLFFEFWAKSLWEGRNSRMLRKCRQRDVTRKGKAERSSRINGVAHRTYTSCRYNLNFSESDQLAESRRYNNTPWGSTIVRLRLEKFSQDRNFDEHNVNTPRATDRTSMDKSGNMIFKNITSLFDVTLSHRPEKDCYHILGREMWNGWDPSEVCPWACRLIQQEKEVWEVVGKCDTDEE